MSGLMTRVCSAAALAAALAACGGGGGSSTLGGPPPVTPAPTPPASATPTPVPPPSATPTPLALQYTGRVVDTDHGNAPVAGASVSVGTSFGYVAGSGYVLAGTTATATTASDGSFTISGSGAPTFIQVTAAGLVAAHRPLPAVPSNVGVVLLPTATTDELAGLAELNAHRAQLGAGRGALPIGLDADVELSARAHAADEAAKGYYGHVAPGTNYLFVGRYLCGIGGFCGNPYFIQENLDAAPGGIGNLVFADDAYISAGPSDGHYQNVVSKSNFWAGFGDALNGIPDPSSLGIASENYYVENFITSTANPSP